MRAAKFLVLMLGVITRIGAQNVDLAESTIKIVIFDFDARTLAPAYRDLGSRLSSVLSAELEGLPGRTITNPENLVFQDVQYRKKLKERLTLLEGAQKERDIEALKARDVKKLESLNATLKLKQDEYQNFLKTDLETLSPKLDTVWSIANTRKAGSVFDPAQQEKLWTSLKEQGYWYAVHGRVEQSGDYFRVTLTLDHVLLKEQQYEGTAAFYISDRGEVPVSLVNAMVKTMLSYVPARLEVDPGTPDAYIELSPAAPRRAFLWPWLKPASYTLTVHARGYKKQIRVLELKEGQRASVSFEPEAEVLGTLRIQSTPEARLFDGTEYLGLTPIDIDKPMENTLYRLVADGYDEARVLLGPSSPDLSDTRLLKKGLGYNELLVSSRDAMYKSLGITVVSLAFPLLFDALLVREQNIYESTLLNPDFKDEVGRRGNIFFLLRNASYGISAFLLVDTLTKMAAYIAVGDSLDLN